MMQVPDIAAAWQARHGHAPLDADVDAAYKVFVPMNEAVIADYVPLIPGAKPTYDELRALGLKIGSITGYTRSIMNRVLPLAAAPGHAPDNLVCASDMPNGRPTPTSIAASSN